MLRSQSKEKFSQESVYIAAQQAEKLKRHDIKWKMKFLLIVKNVCEDMGEYRDLIEWLILSYLEGFPSWQTLVIVELLPRLKILNYWSNFFRKLQSPIFHNWISTWKLIDLIETFPK